MTGSFHWESQYSVKVRAMDEQHKRLFELMDELQGASDCDSEIIGDVLRRLLDYTSHHFDAEENLLEKYKFAGLATHRGEHRVLREKVLAFKKEFDAGNACITGDLTRFLQRWLSHHIQTVDRRYSDFLNARGVR